VSVVRIEDRRPHLGGPARCLECRHEWIAVAPIGTTVLECPACHADKGARLAMIEHDGPHWTCVCGNALFFVMPERIYCPNCGLEQGRCGTF
jgi:Zn finger protein HypA/HybF involved in hydrogenase expression